MRKTFLFLTLLFLVFGCSAKGNQQSPQTPEEFTGSLLWKVSGNGLEKPSYIFGTYHFYGPELVEKTAGLSNAIESTEQVIGEVIMEDMQKAQMPIMMRSMLSEEESYKNLLTEDEYNHLDNSLRGFSGAGLEQWGKFNPTMVSMSLYQVMQLMIDPSFNPLAFESIDQYLQRINKENNKPVLGLETINFQIDLLFNSNQDMRTRMLGLICTLDNIDFLVEQLKTVSDNYLSGNLDAMYKDGVRAENTFCKEYEDPEFMSKLLKERNDNWMKQLPAIFSEKSTLVAVGAGHLAGEEGILYQLSQLGYTVEPVK